MSIKKNTIPTAANVPAPKAEKPEVIVAEETSTVKINRKELAHSIHAKVHAAGKAVPLKVAEIMVAAYEEAVIEAMSRHAEVVLPGFGKFYTVEKPEQERHNPSTGDKIMVPAHTAVKFKFGSKLKNAAIVVPE